jgi:hypothetical protein
MTAPSPPEVEATQRRLFKVFADRRSAQALEELIPPGSTEGTDGEPRRMPLTGRPQFHLACLALAVILWLWALQSTDLSNVGDYGLLSALPPTLYLALGVLTVGFLCGVRSEAGSKLLAPYLVLFVAVVHASPVFLYGTLRYAWAWKHVGVVDYLMRHHALDPHLSFLPVYQNWPGFFGVATTLTEAAGLRSALSFAAWAPPVFELLNLAAVWVIVSSLSRDRRVRWTTCWFFLIANWVGQNYFAPQAFVYFLYLVALGIVLRSLSKHPAAPRLLRKLIPPLRATAANPEPTTAGTSTWETVDVLCVIFAAVATSHPLTPIVLTAGLVGLALFGVLRIRTLPLIMAAMTVGWLLTGARTFFNGNIDAIFNGFGSFSTNFSSNLVQLSHVEASQRLVAQMGRIEVATVGALAVLGFLRRIKRGHWDAAGAVLLASPVVILLGGNYEGEALFRVFLFALPFAAFFIALLLYPGADAGRGWFTTGFAIAASALVLTGFLFAYYGKEAWSYFSPGEVRAAELVYNHAPPGTLLVEGTREYPTQFRDAENITYVAIASEPVGSSSRVIAHPVRRLAEWLGSPRYQAAFILITQAQKAQVDALGSLPRGSLDRIERALLASPRFQVVYHDADASVFRLRHYDSRTRR